MITCWFNWVGLIVYAVMLLFYLATRENITGESTPLKETDAKYYLLGIAIFFPSFRLFLFAFIYRYAMTDSAVFSSLMLL